VQDNDDLARALAHGIGPPANQSGWDRGSSATVATPL